MDLTFREILTVTKGSPIGLSGRDLKRQVRGVAIDSRTVKAEEVFFALRGEHYDAHTFLHDVVEEKGAVAIVERSWLQKNEGRLPRGRFIAVDHTLQALQDVAAFYRKKFNIPVLAITGSNGKTTTKEMIAAILSRQMRTLKNPGNLNNHIGVPLTLFALTHRTQIAIVEMGANHFGEIARLCEIANPDFGLITNIGRAHLEFFGSLQDVARAKGELFHFLFQKDGLGFVNLDDERVREVAHTLHRTWNYSFEKEANVRGEWIDLDEWGRPRFRIAGLEIHLRVPGRHQAQNALAAAAVGLFFNLPPEEVKKGLEEFVGVDKRMELREVEGVLILNDTYNANLNSMQQALKTLAHLQQQRGGRSFAVLGDMLELGAQSEKEHRLVGEAVAATNVSTLLTYGPQARFIYSAAREKGIRQAFHFEDKEELQQVLLNSLRGGDLVLVKGSRGMKMETIVEFLKRALTHHESQ